VAALTMRRCRSGDTRSRVCVGYAPR